jgi:hypothetical protein
MEVAIGSVEGAAVVVSTAAAGGFSASQPSVIMAATKTNSDTERELRIGQIEPPRLGSKCDFVTKSSAEFDACRRRGGPGCFSRP